MAATINCRMPRIVSSRKAIPDTNTQPSATGQGTCIAPTTVKAK